QWSATNHRCQRNSVSGFTMKIDHRSRPSTRVRRGSRGLPVRSADGSRGVAARRAVGAIRGSRHLWKIPAAAQHRHVDHEPDDTIETSNASILSAQITFPARKTQVTMSTGVFGTHRPIAARIRQVLVVPLHLNVAARFWVYDGSVAADDYKVGWLSAEMRMKGKR